MARTVINPIQPSIHDPNKPLNRLKFSRAKNTDVAVRDAASMHDWRGFADAGL